jgi:hypothetical protein
MKLRARLKLIENWVSEAARIGRDYYLSSPHEMKALLMLAQKCEELEPRIKRLRLKCADPDIVDELRAISKELQNLIESSFEEATKPTYSDGDDSA